MWLGMDLYFCLYSRGSAQVFDCGFFCPFIMCIIITTVHFAYVLQHVACTPTSAVLVNKRKADLCEVWMIR